MVCQQFKLICSLNECIVLFKVICEISNIIIISIGMAAKGGFNPAAPAHYDSLVIFDVKPYGEDADL